VAVSRRSGDEIQPWPPDGGLRPFTDDGPGKTSGRLLVLHCGAMQVLKNQLSITSKDTLSDA
jgi:hypothetical protein